jgi:hypothetical protein
LLTKPGHFAQNKNKNGQVMDSEFVERFLIPHLMEDNEFAATATPKLNPADFDGCYGLILTIIKAQRDRAPTAKVTKDVLLVEIDRRARSEYEIKGAKDLVERLPAVNGADRAWLIEGAEKAIGAAMFERSLAQAIDAKQEHKRAEHLARATEACAFTFKQNDLDMNIDDIFNDYTPPQYLIERLFKRGYLYGLTGLTGSGKTAVALALARAVCRGQKIGERAAMKGRVIYLAGENPDDVQARCIAMFDRADDLRMFPQATRANADSYITHLIKRGEPIALVVVDTSTAYFAGEDENDNKQSLEHAKWLRSMAQRLPGNPTVLVCCHPVKNASDDNMVPRGGSAFLNEIDGNLAATKVGDMTVIKQHGKYRDVDFPGIAFAREVRYPDRLQGIPTVTARYATDDELIKTTTELADDDQKVLEFLIQNPGARLREIAIHMKWATKKKEPDTNKAKRSVDRLLKQKLIDKDWSVTDVGRELAA